MSGIQVVSTGIKVRQACGPAIQPVRPGNLTVQECRVSSTDAARFSEEQGLMSWKTPKIIEIALGAEINCYACAELK
jgi:coenzyme PQQ precursor peptide PqqA